MESNLKRATVITVSDRSFAGEREDFSGPLAAELLGAAGWTAEVIVVPDDQTAISSLIVEVVEAGAQLVVTTGGTGVGPRDVTPEATASLLTLELPGVAEEIRRVGIASLPQAMLSRGVAGMRRGALVVNLAGSTGAVRDGVPVVISVAQHAVDQAAGGDH
ncbi:MogA/MoaB family molybdenum cofactor biosynthesis protein [Gordonia hydrophobica]|uniref:MogA/MoaB family molybdenum cofactor biosynthesis protein n=1 Tax=Gordonia hydrophobica TaxID=40516 RepID=A0ABZ2TX22_9ACTN|nr:MogA/MoaB family molybdenum cofactor biosynthesis protein [Gordonia hydrophobica]MBM7369300.1 molybdenum cofactor synthesis domain-containing protein [Gordonia hydrophobica]